MTGFAWVYKHGWCACRGQCGGNLAANVATFTHAHHNDVAGGFKQQMNGFDKSRGQPIFDLQQRLGFDIQGLVRQLQNARVVWRENFVGSSLF